MNRETLRQIRARVQVYRPDLAAPILDMLINDRIRLVIESRPYWTDLVAVMNRSVAPAVTEGTVSVRQGSDRVSLSGATWPVDDLYSGALAQEVSTVGYQWVTLNPAPGDIVGRWAVVDSGANQEYSPVVDSKEGKVLVDLRRPHASGTAVSVSSLSGRRFRCHVVYGWYPIKAVVSPTELVLTRPWAGPDASDQTYSITDSFIRMPPDTRGILEAVWMNDGMRLMVGHPVRLGVAVDPRREAQGSPPLAMIETETDQTGTVCYELWPAPTSASELRIVYTRQWPRLVRDNDLAPWFINPEVFSAGAIADALRIRRGSEDAYWNPQLAEVFERRFRELLMLAQEADERKAVKDYSWLQHELMGVPSSFWQTTDPAILEWDL